MKICNNEDTYTGFCHQENNCAIQITSEHRGAITYVIHSRTGTMYHFSVHVHNY